MKYIGYIIYIISVTIFVFMSIECIFKYMESEYYPFFIGVIFGIMALVIKPEE